MKWKFLQLLFMPLVLIVLYSYSCEKDLEDDDAGSGSGGMNLVCGSSMPSGFQCIRNGSAGTPATYNISEVIGSWDSDDFDFCVKYNSDGTGMITYKPSAFVTGSTQTIKWGAMVNSKGEPIISNAGTVYIVHESTNGTPVDAQIASLSFKRSTRQWYGFDLVPVSSCGSVSSGGGSGKAMFWVSADKGCGSISVNVNGQSKTITNYYSSGTPDCGATGCATFDLAPGTYNYTATCSGYQWSNSITVTAGGCSRMKLQ